MINNDIPDTITIDGPAGAGKSTLGELLAQRLGYLYFDTGIMYRALTWAMIQHGIDPNNAEEAAGLAQRLDIEVQAPEVNDGRQYTVRIDGRDVTWELRSPDVDRNVSIVARPDAVREVMRARQREIGLRGRIVMVGRDIGSKVMPEAALKIYLQASLEERARRRVVEIKERGRNASLEQIRSEVARRDALDQHVMAPAPDALLISSEGRSPEQIVEEVLARIEQRTR